MANTCMYRVKVKGKRNACYAYYGSMSSTDPIEIISEKGTNEICTLEFEGYCKWAVDWNCSSWDGEVPVKLPENPNMAMEEAINKYQYIDMESRANMFNVEVWCKWADLDNFDFETEGIEEHYKPDVINSKGRGNSGAANASGIDITLAKGADITLDGMINAFRVMSEEQIKDEGERALTEIAQYFLRMTGDPNRALGMTKNISLILAQAACGADGKLVPKEIELLKSAFGENIVHMADSIEDAFGTKADRSVIEELKNIVSNDDLICVGLGVSMSKFMMSFIAIDGEISESEVESIKEIFSKTFENLGMHAAKQSMMPF